ncbi:hypothetical protein MKW94_010832 [Papaver nudicaule]|uniref:Uncharacterized protein n=1 Tax=Papaver nudicaule TaxID=74823 RepID=A0AA41VSQ4_PAPNU|nr:hypothetical protein [Papaver nudicaule]
MACFSQRPHKCINTLLFLLLLFLFFQFYHVLASKEKKKRKKLILANNSQNSWQLQPLKSAALLDQMKLHLATDAGKDLVKKIGLVYQINIGPKKMGIDEEIFVVDLRKEKLLKNTLYTSSKYKFTIFFLFF